MICRGAGARSCGADQVDRVAQRASGGDPPRARAAWPRSRWRRSATARSPAMQAARSSPTWAPTRAGGVHPDAGAADDRRLPLPDGGPRDQGGLHEHDADRGLSRGAGRPEAAYYIERIMDVLADELGMDPVELRRKNFIPPDAFPYQTPTGPNYDSGEYDKPLTKALEIAGYDELRAEQARRRRRRGATSASAWRPSPRSAASARTTAPRARRAERAGDGGDRHLAPRPGAGDDASRRSSPTSWASRWTT